MNLSAFFLVGPTAVGKSRIAQYIAEKHNYAILSADSMLVYKGMDIGTAKPSREEMSRVIYGGINLVEAGENFSVADYRCHALAFLREMKKRNVPVIIVGGSGLYIKSLTHGLDNAAKANPEERQKWLEILEKNGIEALQKEIISKYQDAGEIKDFLNPRRLIRYLEKKNSQLLNTKSWEEIKQQAPMAGVDMKVNNFREAVRKRVNWMYENGLLEECKNLLISDKFFSGTSLQAIGYAEAIAFLKNEISREGAIEKTVKRTIQLGKKQRTWFRWQAMVEWVEVSPEMTTEEIAERVVAIWNKYGPLPIYENKENKQ
mgnify:CR=1 FL=1